MALAECNTAVSGDQRELTKHGTVSFPAAFYHDDLGREEVPWHWHEEWEAVFVPSGCCIVAAGQEKYTLQQGQGFFVNTGVFHGCWDLEHSQCRFHSMVFHPRLVGGSLDSVFYQEYVLPLMEHRQVKLIPLTSEVPWQRQALDAIEFAWRAGVEEPKGHEFLVRARLSELVFLLWEHIPRARQQSSDKAIREGQRIKVMLQFIHDHSAEPLDTAAIAASAAVSESEALRCFRSTIGTTPIQYVRQYRISQACRLLRTTQERIGDIAEGCGFSDVSYFTKTFREMKGCTPAQFRNQS